MMRLALFERHCMHVSHTVHAMQALPRSRRELLSISTVALTVSFQGLLHIAAPSALAGGFACGGELMIQQDFLYTLAAQALCNSALPPGQAWEATSFQNASRLQGKGGVGQEFCQLLKLRWH